MEIIKENNKGEIKMNKTRTNILLFLKRNAIYLVLGLCIIAVGLSITFMLLQKQNDLSLDAGDTPAIIEPDPNKPSGPSGTPDDENVEPVQKPVVFIMPVSNSTSINEYSTTMVYNSTLNRYSSHLAVDFFASEGAEVFAVYDGVIASVETTFLQGTTITIDHGNGLSTVYNSLLDGDSVTVGQQVSQGDVIGQISVSNRQEYKDGAHLHFEVRENGTSIDPVKYLVYEEK